MAQFPSRPANAPPGSKFFEQLGANDSSNRDELITQEILRGNFPDFMRKEVPITVTEGANTLIYFVMPDYLCLGDDQDYVRVPLGAQAGQRIADAFGCTLPTAKMSDQIWKAATAKVAPKPMSGMTSNIGGKTYSPRDFLAKKMSDTDSFVEHNRLIQEQLQKQKPGELVAGHKKDVILSNNLGNNPGRVAIHGLHDLNGKAIQSSSTAHDVGYRDYSHGIRLVDKAAKLNGKPVDLVENVLKDPKFAGLISSEGAMQTTAYNYSDKNNQVAQVDKSSVKGRIQLLERINDYLDKIKLT